MPARGCRILPCSFNPHPARRPGATWEAIPSAAASTFQSSPGPKAGCYVSIIVSGYYDITFQSSPGPKAGCYAPRNWLPSASPKFQSSPGPKAGCYGVAVLDLDGDGLVSILTRPEGRVLLADWVGDPDGDGRFNPHPARRPGATPTGLGPTGATSGFNPHPARRPGATGPAGVTVRRTLVSILTRPEGRVLPPVNLPLSRPRTGFNPHPARRPGATKKVSQITQDYRPVSILTRPEGRVLPDGQL